MQKPDIMHQLISSNPKITTIVFASDSFGNYYEIVYVDRYNTERTFKISEGDIKLLLGGFCTSSISSGDYIRIKKGDKWFYLHKLVKKLRNKKNNLVHHQNFNSLDNRRHNLIEMNKSIHTYLHKLREKITITQM